jgi:hypothetical protein
MLNPRPLVYTIYDLLQDLPLASFTFSVFFSQSYIVPTSTIHNILVDVS